ncbi:MAG: RdgB/HAM1 family non-canonical purine NTP pyrophosphatase [Candidatus Acidiferrales bacterium]
MLAPAKSSAANPAPVRVLLATSNPGKLREYAELVGDSPIVLAPFPNFSEIAAFEESAPTFAENAAGKALHYSRHTCEIVLADDSGIVVPALGGAPGVHSARYAGPHATDADRVQKLLRAMEDKEGPERSARFVCVTAIARQGRVLAVVSDCAEGMLTKEPRGTNGFGYDPIFFFGQLGRTYAETTPDEKNRYSHRGKAFRKALAVLAPENSVTFS